jgi:hypothetical protein
MGSCNIAEMLAWPSVANTLHSSLHNASTTWLLALACPICNLANSSLMLGVCSRGELTACYRTPVLTSSTQFRRLRSILLESTRLPLLSYPRTSQMALCLYLIYSLGTKLFWLNKATALSMSFLRVISKGMLLNCAFFVTDWLQHNLGRRCLICLLG